MQNNSEYYASGILKCDCGSSKDAIQVAHSFKKLLRLGLSQELVQLVKNGRLKLA